MFFLALTFGMDHDVKQGISNMVGFIEKVGYKYDIEFPIQMSLGISDGESLFGFRYSTKGSSRSLFHIVEIDAMREIAPDVDRFSSDSRALVSEPLSALENAWVPIPESSFVRIYKGEVEIEDFNVNRI